MEQWTSGEVTLRGGGGHRRGLYIHKNIPAVGKSERHRPWNRPLEEVPEEGPQVS